MSAEFSVCQFFPDGTCEYTLRRVTDGEAVREAKRLTETVGGRLGWTERIIITDGDDYTVFEWKFGEGVTYPTPEMRAAHEAAKQGAAP